MIGFINIATETGIQNENDYILFFHHFRASVAKVLIYLRLGN